MPTFTLDFGIRHESVDPLFELDWVKSRALVNMVEWTPFDRFHLRTLLRESGLDPINIALEVEPELIGIRVMLMVAHICFDLTCRILRPLIW